MSGETDLSSVYEEWSTHIPMLIKLIRATHPLMSAVFFFLIVR